MAKRDGCYYRDGAFWISWNNSQGIRRRRKTAAASLAEARQIRAEELRKAETARVLGFQPPSEHSFESLAREYLQRQKANVTPSAYCRESGIIENHLKPFFSGPIATIRRVQLEKYLVRRGIAGASAYSIRKELQILKHILSFAVALEYLPLNPAAGVSGPKEPPGRVRYLQPEELRKVLECCPPWLRPLAGLAVTTGMRLGEILSLRWMDVDPRNCIATLPRSKNGEPRTVYLNDMASHVIASLSPGKPAERVFNIEQHNRVSVAFSRACKAAGIHDFRFHDLRHTAASWLRMSGADLHTTAMLLGHKSLRMTQRYSHLSPSFLSKEVGRLDSVFAGILPRDAVVTNGAPTLLPAAHSGKQREDVNMLKSNSFPLPALPG